MDLKQYRAKLDAVLMSGSPKRLKQFMRHHRLPMPSSDAAAEVTLHKTITASTSLPLAYRQQSKAWLSVRGYHSLDDGEL